MLWRRFWIAIRCWLCERICGPVTPWFESVATARTNDPQFAGGAATALTIGMPPGFQAGDLLIAVMGVSINPTVTVSPGWNQIAEEDCPNFACELSAYWRIADGTEANITFDFGPNPLQASGAVLRYGGFDANDPIAQHGTQSGVDTTPTAPALAGLHQKTRVLWACLAQNAQRTLDNPPSVSRFERASTWPIGPGASAAADGVNLRGSDGAAASDGTSPAVSWQLTKTFEGGAVDPNYTGDPWRTLSIAIRGGDPCVRAESPKGA